MSLQDTLTAWVAVNDPWLPDYQVRKAEATDTMRTEVEQLAETGYRAAIALADALNSEDDYCARNAASGDKMHRKVPEYGPAVHDALARLQADQHHIAAGEDTAWCDTCKRRRVVEEASDESAYVGQHEVGYWVQRLMCGHQVQSQGRIIGASPGGGAAAEAMAGDATRRRIERSHSYHSYED